MNHSGDDSLSALYLHHRAELSRFLNALTGDAGETDDILQEVWLRADERPAGSVDNWRAYLFRMAHNLHIDRLRQRRRREVRERRWTEEAVGPFAASEEVADPTPGADEEMARREEAAALASAIANLPVGARQAFELHKLEGLSHGEVAARLGISKSGVEKHMAVAMKHLRRMLAD